MLEPIFTDVDLEEMAYADAVIERAKELVSAAEQYEKAGYVTFPLTDQKLPMVTDFNHLSLPKTKREWTDRWWKRINSPGCGLGLSTSSNIFILDIDNKHTGSADGYLRDDYGAIIQGERLLDWLDSRYGLAGVPISRTPSDGFHLIYSGEGYDWSLVNQQQDVWTPYGKLEADTRPPYKGMSVEWPTRTPKGEYKWIQPLPHKNFLPKLPEEIYGWCVEWKRMRERETAYDASYGDYKDWKRLDLKDGDKATAALYRHTLEYIEAKYPVQKGTRNETLNKIALTCYWGAGLTEELTRLVVAGWADFAWRSCGERVPSGAVSARVKGAMSFKPHPGYVGFLRRQLHMD